MKPLVSVILPTHKRARMLEHVLGGLRNQTYKNFEVVVVFKPAHDETEKVLRKFRRHLSLKTVIQKKGWVSVAYNLGIKEAKGQILAFLDDDAVPYPNWLEQHVDTYINYTQVGGVSGKTFSATISDTGVVKRIPEESVYPFGRQKKHYDLPWERPLLGMSNWLIFFGKDGWVHHHHAFSQDIEGKFPSLLFMGANMSVRRKAVEDLRINENIILGFAFEQLLAYQIFCNGYKLLFNSGAKVLHIVHDESLGRFFRRPQRAALRDAELALTFFFLKSQEKGISYVGYALELLKLILARVYRAKEYGGKISVYRIYGLIYGFKTGFAHIISNSFQGNFSLNNSLKRLSKHIQD